MDSLEDKNKERTLYLVYDHECPFCRRYCHFIRLRDTVDNLVLVDARQPSAIMNQITADELDVDQGMVVKMGDHLFYGAEAIHMLVLLTTRLGIVNRLNYWLFSSKTRAEFVYPILVFCRNIALKIMGIALINNLKKD